MRTKLLLFLTSFLMLQYDLHAHETEPNNNFRATADELSFNHADQGECSDNTDVDYWKVTTNVDGMLVLNFSTAPTSCITVALVSGNGTELQYLRNINGSTTLYYYALAPDDYYFRISACQYGAYSLNASFVSETTPKDPETNDDISSATLMSINSETWGHVGFRKNGVADRIDYFKFISNLDGDFQITLKSKDSRNVSLRLVNDEDVQLAIIPATNTEGSISVYGLSAGTYYFSVAPNSEDWATYSVQVALNPTSPPNDDENNNTTADAKSLAPQGSQTGHLAFYNNHYTDNIDWYYITTTYDGKLTLTGASHLTTALFLTLYDGDGVTPLTNAIKIQSNTQGSFEKDGLAPGKYYVSVQPEYYWPTAYTLSSNFVEAQPENDVVSNDSPSDGTQLKANDTKTGHLGFRYLGNSNTVDWYKVTLPSTSVMHFNLQNNSGYPVKMDLYDRDMITPLGSIQSSNGQTTNWSTATYVSGTYYAKVYCDAVGWNTYSLTNIASQISLYNSSLNGNILLGTAPTGDPDAKPDAVKICADGSHATYLDYVNDGSHVTGFRIKEDVTGQQKDVYGFLDNTTKVKINGTTERIVYNHPTYMNENAVYKTANIEVYDIYSYEVLYDYPIRIYRAPLLLVHGLWGDASSFDNFEDNLIISGLYPPLPWTNKGSFLISRGDYRNSSDYSFEANKTVVKELIENLIRGVVQESYSCGKVDVIAHSLGGILTRLYIQNPYGSVPYNQNIHKLITINTSHSGTQLANAGADPSTLASIIVKIRNLYKGNNLYIESPALANLQVNSDAILKTLNGPTRFRNGLVPTMTLFSRLDHPYTDGKINECDYVALVTNSINLFNNEASDGIVPVSSQQANAFPVSSIFTEMCHVGVMNYLSVIDQCKQLVNAPLSTNYFDMDGYIPPVLKYNYTSKALVNIENAQTVIITSPLHGLTYKPGQKIKVNVNGSTQTKKVQLYIGNEIVPTSSFDTIGTKLSANYIVPYEAAGKIMMIAFAIDSLDQYVFDTLGINIIPTASLDSIAVYPSDIFVPENLTTGIGITGYFHDGYTREISSLPDIQYLINDTIVARHTTLNQLQGKKKDTTSLTISYLGRSKTIPVQVTDGSDYLHAGFVTYDTLICRNQQVHYTNYSTGTPDSIRWVLTGATPATTVEQSPVVVYKKPGAYDARLICYYATKKDTLTLPQYIKVVGKAPAKPGKITITQGSNKVCAGDTVSYSISPVPNTTGYTWKVPVGASILDGQGTSTVTVLYSSAFLRNDSVSVAAINGCGTSLSSFSKVTLRCRPLLFSQSVETVGSADSKFIVYPNPFTNTLTVKGAFLSNRACHISLIDVLGRICVEQTFTPGTSSEAQLHTGNLHRGFYFLVIQSDTEKKVLKVEKL